MHYYVPDIVMLCELGIKDIEFEIYKRKISFYKKIIRNRDGNVGSYNKFLNDAYHEYEEWEKDMKRIMREMGVSTLDFDKSDEFLKEKVERRIREKMVEQIEKEARKVRGRKCVKYYKEMMDKECGGIKFEAEYTKRMTREGVKNILEARVKLFPVRKNFKHVSVKDGVCCRWCERTDKEESEEHIFRECRKSPMRDKVEKLDVYNLDIEILWEMDRVIRMYYGELRKRGERY